LVSASLNYMLNETEMRNDDSNGAVAGYQFSGMSDPTFRVNYRYLGSLTGRFFASAFATYAPSFGTSRPPIANVQAGNNLAGHTTTQIGTNFYWVAGRHEWTASAEAIYTGNSTSENQVNQGNTQFVDSYWRYVVDANYRFHLCEKFYVGLLATLNFAHNQSANYVNSTPPVSESGSYPFYIVPQLQLGWHLTPGSVIQLTYSYTSYSDMYTTSSSGNTDSTQVRQQFLALSTNFEF
jgi:hypothetical protein